MFGITIGIDIGTAVSFFVTGFISAWVFFRRYKEESRKNRIAQLDAKSLEFLFRLRDSLVRLAVRVEALPKVNDKTADAFFDGVNEMRSEIRELVDEFILYGDVPLLERLRARYKELDVDYWKFVDDFNRKSVNYDIVNHWKGFLFELIEQAHVMILEVWDANGVDKKKQIQMARSFFGEMRAKFEE